MAVEVVTKEDLIEFRHQLLSDIKTVFSPKHQQKQKQWLKSSEVRKLLKISPGTLQNMRINGTLSFTKVGGIIFYNYDDLETLLEQNKTESFQNKKHFKRT